MSQHSEFRGTAVIVTASTPAKGNFLNGFFNGGVLQSTAGVGNFVMGRANAGTMEASSSTQGGNFVFGNLHAGSALTASGPGGAMATGIVNGTAAQIVASNSGAWAHGAAIGSVAQMSASGVGSHASGEVGTNGSMASTNDGSFSHGVVAAAAGTVSVANSGTGAIFLGRADNSGTSLTINVAATGSQIVGNFSSTTGAKTLGFASTALGSGIYGSITDFTTFSHSGPGSFFFGQQLGTASSTTFASTAAGSFWMGRQVGTLTISSTGTWAGGTNGGTLNMSQQNTFWHGELNSGCTVTCSTQGAGARGFVNQSSSTVTSSGLGSWWSGRVNSGARATVSGDGAHILSNLVSGGATFFDITVSGNGSLMAASWILTVAGARTATMSGVGSLFLGRGLDFASAGFTYSASGSAFIGTFGTAATTTATFSMTGSGLFCAGLHEGQISQGGDGSAIVGAASATGTNIFSVNGTGALAGGHISGTATITASGIGSHARGRAVGFGITASGSGSFAGGAALTALISASGVSSFAWGDGSSVTGDYGSVFGFNNENTSYSALVIGRFASVSGFTATSWVSTDPAFVIGNGTGTGTRANAFVVLKDATVQFKGVIDATASGVSGKGMAVWKKYTLTFTNFSAAALTNSITLFSLPQYGIIEHVVIAQSTSFTGGAISAYTVEVGITGNTSKYASPFDVFQAPGAGVGQTSSVADFESLAGAINILATATSVGANLNAATQGSVDIWVKWGTLQ